MSLETGGFTYSNIKSNVYKLFSYNCLLILHSRNVKSNDNYLKNTKFCFCSHFYSLDILCCVVVGFRTYAAWYYTTWFWQNCAGYFRRWWCFLLTNSMMVIGLAHPEQWRKRSYFILILSLIFLQSFSALDWDLTITFVY